MRALTCFYCREAGKSNNNHNASLCCNFSAEEFKILKLKFEKKEKERKEKGNKTKQNYNINDEDGDSSYLQFPDES